MARSDGTFKFAANFDGKLKAPIDARQSTGLKSDLIQASTWTIDGDVWTYPSMIVGVAGDTTENNGIYILLANDYTNSDNWLRVGDLTLASLTKPGAIPILSGNTTDYIGGDGAWHNTSALIGPTGPQGKSAYQVWLDAGNTGTVNDFLNAITGTDGAEGLSAYEVWLAAGHTGTVEQYLASLKGAQGVPGTNGTNGDSAYQIWLNNGHVGTEADFLASLKGEKGDTGESLGVFQEDLTVNLGTGGSVGGIKTGDFFAKGSLIETWARAVSIKTVAPTYTSPTLTLLSTPSTSGIEVGTNITVSLTGNFTQNDAGSLQTTTFYKNSIALSGSTDSIQVTESTINYSATSTYAEGAIKNDNLGNPYPTGHISAGSINSNNVSYIGYRYAFYGFNTTPSTSAIIRAFSGKVLNPQNGTTIIISIPVGTTKVSFTYPATLRDVSSVKYVQGMNAEIKDIFVSGTTTVEGANGYSPISYKTYTYTPANPYSQTATYNVTI